MLPRTIELQNSDGSVCRWITGPEAERLLSEEKVHRVSRRKAAKQIYRYHPIAAASMSPTTSAEINRGDVGALVGEIKATPKRVERLVSFSLIPNIPIPERSVYIEQVARW